MSVSACEPESKTDRKKLEAQRETDTETIEESPPLRDEKVPLHLQEGLGTHWQLENRLQRDHATVRGPPTVCDNGSPRCWERVEGHLEVPVPHVHPVPFDGGTGATCEDSRPGT